MYILNDNNLQKDQQDKSNTIFYNLSRQLVSDLPSPESRVRF